MPFERQDRLDVAVAPLLGRAAGRVALDDEQLGLLGVGAVAVVQLAGQVEPAADRRLAPDLRGGRPAGLAGLGRLDHPRGDRVAHALVLEQEVLERGPDHRLDLRLDLGVVQPPLGLALELRLVHADRQHGRQPFADVLALDLHPLLDQVVRLHEPLHGRADGRAACPARGCRRPRVGIVLTNERTSSSVASVQARARWQRRPSSSSSRSSTNGKGGDPLVVALPVDRVEEVGDAAVVAELDVRLVLLVDELDHQALVEVGLDLEPLGDQRGVVVDDPGRSRGRA